MDQVIAKFKVVRPINDGENITVQGFAVSSGSPENESFSKYTPFGNFTLGIDVNKPAANFFKEGDDIFALFSKVKIDSIPFEKGKQNLSFGDAIEALKQGKRVCRIGWNGKGMFIFMRPADEIHILAVAKNIKSLPESVKNFYHQDCIDVNGKEFETFNDDDVVKFTSYLCLKDAQGCVVNGWLASQTDILAEDYEILD